MILQGAKPMAMAQLRSMFDNDIAVAISDPQASHYRALPQEYHGLPRSADKRRRAFSAGRAAAHEAMTTLDVPVQPVLFGPDRAPVWPAGLVGSISHSDTCCIAALAKSDAYLAIGVDVEENTPLAADLIPTICGPAERTWLDSHPKTKSGSLAKLIFSAKECAYKCQYALTQTLFGFDGFQLIPDLENGQFTAIFTRTVGCFASETLLQGRFDMRNGLIITTMSIRADAAGRMI
ncbi:MAG: 4'-phosphopantetheinyl transferase EntD [Paracoccaceae bacterium]|jgi:4'-phosphopantetheinyl transferase EntD